MFYSLCRAWLAVIPQHRAPGPRAVSAVNVSSLGHNVLIPALIGGSWARDLNVPAVESPYLAFIVGLHVATAIALLIYFWRDWVRITKGFFSSLGQIIRPAAGSTRWDLQPDEQLAWLIILATIPVGLAGLAFEHAFRVIFGKPAYAAVPDPLLHDPHPHPVRHLLHRRGPGQPRLFAAHQITLSKA